MKLPHLIALSAGLLAATGCGPKIEEFDLKRSPEQVEKAYQLQRLGFVCDGRTYADAPAYDPATPGPHPTAAFKNYNSYGAEMRWRPSLESPWEPKTRAEAQLVVCINYSYDGDTSPEVRIVSVRDGREIAKPEVELPQFSLPQADKLLIDTIKPYAEAGA